MAYVQKIVTEDSFDSLGKFVSAGHVGTFEEEHLNGKEPHLADLSGQAPVATVEIAPITVTGPNPTVPQQIPPDALQSSSGLYVQPGKVLVAEVTRPEAERTALISTPEEEAAATEELSNILDEAGSGEVGSANIDNDLVEGTVADVTADLGSKTDDQLAAIEAQEKDREKPRSGVLKAIEAERESRAANQS